jgi:hypothetical protein
MPTKLHAGTYDCYARALPREPLFVLLARDTLAPLLVSLWAAARCGETEVAGELLAELLHAGAAKGPADAEKIREALQRARAMHAYRDGRPYCHVCLCTEESGCPDGCTWTNADRTVCSNPVCVKAAA